MSVLLSYVALHEKCYHLYLAGLPIPIIQNIWLNIDDLERSNIFDDHLKCELTDTAYGFVNQFMIEFIGKVVWHLNNTYIKLLDLKRAVNCIYLSSKLIAQTSKCGTNAYWYYNTYITETMEGDFKQKESRGTTIRYMYAIKKTLRANEVYKFDNDAVIYLGGVLDAVVKNLIKCKTLRKMLEFCQSSKFSGTYVEVTGFI